MRELRTLLISSRAEGGRRVRIGSVKQADLKGCGGRVRNKVAQGSGTRKSMQMDLDADLRRLAACSEHPGLSSIDDAVMATIRERQLGERNVGLRLPVMAGIAAVAFGVASTLAPGIAPDRPAAAPFDPSVALAPSTLLATDR